MVKNMEKPKLIGYVRRGNDGKVKISLDVEALEECQKWEASTGEEYYALDIDMDALLKVLTGRRAVTTIMSGNLENVVGEE